VNRILNALQNPMRKTDLLTSDVKRGFTKDKISTEKAWTCIFLAYSSFHMHL